MYTNNPDDTRNNIVFYPYRTAEYIFYVPLDYWKEEDSIPHCEWRVDLD